MDGLRAVAIIAVLIFHAFPNSFPGGFAGVDVFFVISGFLITSIIRSELDENKFSLASFYSRRVRRIFPSLVIVLSSCAIWGWFFLIPSEYENLAEHIKSGATFISNFTLWNEAGYFDKLAETKPLLHLWSLAIEEQFYILWPLLLILCTRFKISLRSITGTVLLLSFISSVYLTNKNLTAAFYSPASRFWEILIGAMLSTMPLERFKKFANPLSVLGALFLVLSFVLLDDKRNFPGFWALLPTLGTAFIIAAGSGAVINKKILSHPLAVGMGLISYPLYLWHWPLFSFQIISKHSLSVTEKLVTLGAAVGLAYATYVFVEKPLSKIFSARLKVALYSAGMVAMLGLGMFIYENDGLISRFPKDIQEFAKPIPVEKWLTDVRSGVCHIQDPEKDKLSDICFEKGHPSVFLWGDSHAAALVPGLLELQKEKKFSFSQATHVGNPPFIGNDHWPLHYQQHNDLVLKHIKTNKPNTILVHAAWLQYKKPLELMTSGLSKTIQAIKMSSPLSEIVVIGPVPSWKDSLQKNLLKYYIERQELIPAYTNFNLNLEAWDFEDGIREVAMTSGVNYVSPLDHLCRSGECLTRINDSALGLTSFDDAHLSREGALYLITHPKNSTFL